MPMLRWNTYDLYFLPGITNKNPGEFIMASLLARPGVWNLSSFPFIF
jgi:hypothetical protein